jgi:mono/diheme cytochrome c family protein
MNSKLPPRAFAGTMGTLEAIMRFLALIGALAIAAAIGGAVFLFGGFYNVSAADDHFAIVSWALKQTRQASIARQASGNPPGSLDDPATVQAGAYAFGARGCVHCHGAPGIGWDKWSEGMRPYPPNLKDLATERTPAQLFWVVKNGIKFTGMPSFGATEVPDPEIWQIVAFIRKLPTVSEADYQAWSTKK